MRRSLTPPSSETVARCCCLRRRWAVVGASPRPPARRASPRSLAAAVPSPPLHPPRVRPRTTARPFDVPRDAFERRLPPEAKAARSMRLLMTMVALRVVLAQEEGFGNECHDDPSYTETYDDLTTFPNRSP